MVERKLRLHIYPKATFRQRQSWEVNNVPFGDSGMARHVELVGPDDAEFFYMGQFHYEETLRDGVRLERFPFLEQYPERHIADIEGDWDHRRLDPIFWKCVLMMACHSPSLPGKTIFVRAFDSPYLILSMLDRQERFPFMQERTRLGFRGVIGNHWSRLLLLAYMMKWNFPCNWIDHIFILGIDPSGMIDYEKFMLEFGLALSPRGVGNGSLRFYEACFYNCVPVVVSDHGVVGDDYYDTSFIWRMSLEWSEEELRSSFHRLLTASFDELRGRADAARVYFDRVVRSYYDDPTGFFLQWLVRRGLWIS